MGSKKCLFAACVGKRCQKSFIWLSVPNFVDLMQAASTGDQACGLEGRDRRKAAGAQEGRRQTAPAHVFTEQVGPSGTFFMHYIYVCM